MGQQKFRKDEEHLTAFRVSNKDIFTKIIDLQLNFLIKKKKWGESQLQQNNKS